MRALLDVNVLLALLDQDHLDHPRARAWLEDNIEDGWSSCAVTENGFVRVISQPRYPNSISPSAAIDLLAAATKTSHHEFWSCSISLLDPSLVERNRLHGTRQVTDAYLLALAVNCGGRLVTLDRTIPLNAVPAAASEQLVVI
jgi:toxin-antitoxin system PIN domain toxin